MGYPGLEQATETSEAAQADLAALLGDAATLDGQPVFVTEDARIVDADGRDIDPADAERVIWHEGAPGYEDYVTARDAAEDVKRAVEEIEAYSAELENARNRWADEDTPITQEDMEAGRERLDQNVPSMVRQHLESTEASRSLEDSPTVGAKPIL